MSKPSVTGIITAAGLSSRMGSFKPLNDFEGKSYIEAITGKILTFCEKVIVVTGFRKDEIDEVIKKKFTGAPVKTIFNPAFEKGMFTSLQKGIEEAGDSDWILYHFVDQPFFTEEFYCGFIAQLNDSFDWIQPSYNGRMGHPVLFNKKTAGIISDAPEDSNLRIIKSDPSIRMMKWECGYSETLADFDSPECIARFNNKTI